MFEWDKHNLKKIRVITAYDLDASQIILHADWKVNN